MNNKLLGMIKKNPMLYDVLLVFKHRKDKDFLRQIQGLRTNANIVEFVDMPNAVSGDGILCDIEIDAPNDGFFALVRWALDALYFCDCFSLKPFIKFSQNTLYYDNSLPWGGNPFEYYFQQPLSKKEISDCRALIRYDSRNRLKAENLNEGISYQVTENYMEQMAVMMRKYLQFNSETQRIIEEEIKKRSVNEKVLGIHIRGTDYKLNYKDHPIYISPEIYYEYIDSALKKYEFEKLYIATDDEDILKEFINRYGLEKVLYSRETTRGSGTCGVHMGNAIREHHRYRLGLEVICDMCTLSACGGILSSMSQVGLISRIYKRSKKESFKYDTIINKGINQKGNSI